MDETYVKVNGRWAYVYRQSTAGAALSIFISPPVVTAKLHTGFLGNFPQQREEVADPTIHQHGIKRPPMVARSALLNAKAGAR